MDEVLRQAHRDSPGAAMRTSSLLHAHERSSLEYQMHAGSLRSTTGGESGTMVFACFGDRHAGQSAGSTAKTDDLRAEHALALLEILCQGEGTEPIIRLIVRKTPGRLSSCSRLLSVPRRPLRQGPSSFVSCHVRWN